MADETFLFTSESVNEGHPDKLADQVRGGRRRKIWAGHTLRARAPARHATAASHAPLSPLPIHPRTQISDAILDACLEQDPDAKVSLLTRPSAGSFCACFCGADRERKK